MNNIAVYVEYVMDILRSEVIWKMGCPIQNISKVIT